MIFAKKRGSQSKTTEKVGELYAVEELEMKKAPAGTKATDGMMNSRKVQVKAKDCRKIYKNKNVEYYLQIKVKQKEHIDGILQIFVTDEGLNELYLFDIKKVKPKKIKDRKYIGYALRDIKTSFNETYKEIRR